jgi:hypothetical protein
MLILGLEGVRRSPLYKPNRLPKALEIGREMEAGSHKRKRVFCALNSARTNFDPKAGSGVSEYLIHSLTNDRPVFNRKIRFFPEVTFSLAHSGARRLRSVTSEPVLPDDGEPSREPATASASDDRDGAE